MKLWGIVSYSTMCSQCYELEGAQVTGKVGGTSQLLVYNIFIIYYLKEAWEHIFAKMKLSGLKYTSRSKKEKIKYPIYEPLDSIL